MSESDANRRDEGDDVVDRVDSQALILLGGSSGPSHSPVRSENTLSSLNVALVPRRDLGVTGGRVKKAEAGPEEGCGRAPEDKVSFPEVVLFVVVKGVGSPAFRGTSVGKLLSAREGSAVFARSFCGADSPGGGRDKD